jgi:multiple sugar transport system ATP-binding protein
MASVTLKGVRKVYQQAGKDVTAVHGVDLEVKDGELVVLVGPSGCGKSTTLRMVAGLESISAGELRIDDRLVNDVPANDRDVAMVFQSYALYPHMSAYDNMAFALKLRGMTKAEIDTRVKEAAGILGIVELLGRKPKDMSGGQRQRVAVGRAIVRHPRVFLFDEPLSNLDAKLRVQTRREIARLHQQLSATMLYVTHDQVEAMTLGDRIVVLEGGYVKQIDTPMNLYERPKNTFVAGFIGSPSMNLLPGAIISGPGGVGVEFRAADNAFSIALSGDWAKRLGGYGGRAVIMGVRPEDIEPAPDGSLPLGGGAVRVKLDVVEPLGSEAFLSARIGAKEITARVPPRGLPAAGSEVELVFDRERLHFFDAESGETLRAETSAP